MKLKNKNVLITGVSRRKGLGAAIAKAFAREGADLFLCGYSDYDKQMPWGIVASEFSDLILELQSLGIRAQGADFDFSQGQAAPKIFHEAQQFLGHINVLINNAACDKNVNITNMTEESLLEHYHTNVITPTMLCSEFIKFFKPNNPGRIINLTSGQMLTPMPENLSYAISKGAIEALTISLAVPAGKKGITVNAIDPGPTDTGWMNSELISSMSKLSPLGRVGQPEDAAALVLFLASEQGQWITGQILRSRGGL